jgi:5'-deoxynucleotidase YfbR-like HD superfamily hydrolase
MVELLKGEGADGDTLRWALAHEIYEALTGMDVPTPLKKSAAYAPYLEAEKKALVENIVNRERLQDVISGLRVMGEARRAYIAEKRGKGGSR